MNTKKKKEEISHLIAMVSKSRASRFYQTLWEGYDLKNLPVVTQKQMADTPLSLRRYIKGKGITRIVKKGDATFLVERTLDDLVYESYGIHKYHRPLVIFSDGHAAIEKSLWCYEKDILPLIGEGNNIPAAVDAATQYHIDALITDTETYQKIFPFLPSHPIAVVLCDDHFDIQNIATARGKTMSHQYILERPEVGAFAHSCQEALVDGKLLFHDDENSIVEPGKRTLVSKKIVMPTPLIRYETDIRTREEKCSCGHNGFVLL